MPEKTEDNLPEGLFLHAKIGLTTTWALRIHYLDSSSGHMHGEDQPSSALENNPWQTGFVWPQSISMRPMHFPPWTSQFYG
jgi:hypothetical protein